MHRRRLPLSLALAFCALSCTPTGGPTEEAADEGPSEGEPASPEPVNSRGADPGKLALEWRTEPDELTTSPVSLTASDGTGLQLVTMDAKVVIEDPLAFTELTLTFHNPEDRIREGRFEINLPTGAAISRFAMLIDGEWQEAEVVERQAARVAYEDFLHRKQDPALLEKQAGNRFSARVFPIPGNSDKQLKISYSQELRSSKQPYHLMLAGLSRMQEFSVDVAVVEQAGAGGVSSSLGGEASEVEHLRIHERDFAPRSDLEVRFEREVVERGLRSGSLVVGRIAPVIDAAPAPVTGLTVLLDTSASRALGFEGQVDRLAKLLAALGEGADFPLEVVCFDQGVESVYRGSARGFGAEARARILARHPLGASDLAGALKALAAREVEARVLLVSDGIVTVGDVEHEGLRAAVVALGERGVERLDALVDGGIQDELSLKALTTAGLAQAGVVASARLSEDALVRKLSSTTMSGVELVVEGAEWVWPRTLDGVQAGDEVMVYAQLPATSPMVVDLRAGAKLWRIGVPTRAAQGPLMQRAWTQAKIDGMTAELRGLPSDDDSKPQRLALRDEIIELSTRERVLSDFTALLVLETDQDYARFGIDRTALADILTVGPGGVEVIDRSRVEPKRAPAVERERDAEPDREWMREQARAMDPDMADAPTHAVDDDDVWGGLTGTEVGEAYGVGGLGLVGTGRGGGGTGEGTIGLGNTGLIGRGGGGGTGSGYGRGSGAGFGGRGSRTPAVRQAKATVQGNLDRDIIRRIVRAHINEVRACYNRGLTSDPNLHGRVAINFVITGDGDVASAAVADNSTTNEDLGKCIESAVKRWRFPKPAGGGNVIVNYPFELEPDGGPAPASNYAGTNDDDEEDESPRPRKQDAWTGKFADIMGEIARQKHSLALANAWQWRESEPGSELALLALGEAAEASGDLVLASRAYGSLIDLFPARADIRRMAGARLERVAQREGEGARAALELAIDTYAHAVEQRGDHPSSHRLYAFALVKAGRHEDAFSAIVAGLTHEYPSGRFAGAKQILGEDAGLIAAAWIAASPKDGPRISKLLLEHGVTLPTSASTRFVLNWETDANDVDFHIYDSRGGHAYYSDMELRSGGRLYEDVTTGYGPECFTIEGKPKAGPYTLQAHYYSMGPMGYGMGKLEVLRHDGHGGLSFEERPFVIMKDGAFVNLGKG